MSQDSMKKKAAFKAAEWVENHMIVGLGTGSTVFYFIEKLIERCKNGLHIQAVSSSDKSSRQAAEGGIHLLDINTITTIDMTFDGADEIDSQKKMIKGGGGALLREKILADSSQEMVVMVDETKIVTNLGQKAKLPLEILPFAYLATEKKIKNLGYAGEFRKTMNHLLYFTDNGNLIFDITFDAPRKNPEEDHALLIQIPGVLETGFFFNLAGRVIIGLSDGNLKILP